MLTEVKTFKCDFDHTPSDDDILECIELAKKYDCVIELTWCLKWSGHYSRYVYKDSTLESVKDTLPKIYGM